MKESKQTISKSKEFISVVQRSLGDAVGDDIKMDIINNMLDTQNSTPNRIWDFINRNIGMNLSTEKFITASTKRGGWEMKPIFEKETGILYTLMREERFEDLQEEVKKRTSAHYIQALAEILNKEIEVQNEQLTLCSIKYDFSEEKLNTVVHKIFSDLRIPDEIVNNHAIILFRSSGYELTSLRCCVVKSDLSIAQQENWNEYIVLNESVVVERSVPDAPNENNPSNGLKFKKKAKEKLGQKDLSKIKSNKKRQQM